MALRYAIMTALIEDELSGYDLAGSFDKSLGFFWHASHQQIYRELGKLSDLAWVTRRTEAQKGRPDKILYALTDAGREALDEWVLTKDRMRLQETKDELYIKLYNLSESNIDYLRTRLRERREAMMQRLYLYERIRRRHYGDPETLPLRRKGVYLALLGGITGGKQYLAWCDEALELLAGAAEDTSTAAKADTA
ncbi:PadR family transcriptional regulator [Congregibacter litoralis]|uniref:Transcriptional regulator, PadR family n=1 Tax=Congregibacter litoralis KT71 TaxID=314285 RepID=A4A416_9GAMM|nr:PadR family transcriptional regulator [Congregibacter litoralis]EAQ99439.1 transcriptional regulator, PadR family [Congregibacter litoralis KT71]